MERKAEISRRRGLAEGSSQEFDGRLAPTMACAVVTASQEIAASEKWIPSRRGALGSTLPRLMTVILAAGALVGQDRKVRRKIRETSLRLLAYLPADLRLGAVIDIAARNPDILDDLFSGAVSPDHEVYRYNIFSTLGVFARHGLVEEVFSRDRLDRVGRIVERSKRQIHRESEEE